MLAEQHQMLKEQNLLLQEQYKLALEQQHQFSSELSENAINERSKIGEECLRINLENQQLMQQLNLLGEEQRTLKLTHEQLTTEISKSKLERDTVNI